MWAMCGDYLDVFPECRCEREDGHRGPHKAMFLIDHDGQDGLLTVVRWTHVDAKYVEKNGRKTWVASSPAVDR